MKGLYREITYRQLTKLISNKHYILIDIRPEYEYERHHINGAISIPEYELIKNYEELDPRYAYIFICQSGKNSKFIANTLAMYGYNTFNLVGGMETVQP